tara:strand:- start:391 stop:1050 length:660 start_codon:yes stop_codon:yes gene_type:complete
MPESFMKDQTVPARWRLLGIINGFLINGNDFYASNEWIMDKLGCSEQTVSNAVKELEDLGEIICNRTRRSRLIKRSVLVPARPKEVRVSDPKRPRVSDPSQLGSNSVSNAEREIPAKAGETTFEEVPTDVNGELPDLEVKQTKDRGKRMKALIDKVEGIRGEKYANRPKQMKFIKLLKDSGRDYPEIGKQWFAMWNDPYWQEKGFDFKNVADEFDRKNK